MSIFFLYYFFFLYKLLHLIRSGYKNIQNYITYIYTLFINMIIVQIIKSLFLKILITVII